MQEINNIRFRLTLINSLVLLSILAVIVTFVYFNVSYNILQNVDTEILNSAYQLKRYVALIDKTLPKAQEAELSEEYALFTEKSDSSGLSYCVWSLDSTPLTYHDNNRFPADLLIKLRDILFCGDVSASRILEESDGRYYIHEYSFEDINMRVCSTITGNDDGKLRVLQIVSNMNENNAFNERLLRTMSFAIIIGVSLSLVCGYATAGNAIIPIQENMLRQKEFIADASHELRTPITIVRTNLDLVMSSPEESVESQMDWLQNAYSETERMGKLIQDLLFLASSDLDRMRFSNELLNINQLCFELCESIAPAAAEKGIELRCELDDAESQIQGDRSRIEQLLIIVIDNAIQYSPPGSTIRLVTERLVNFIKIQIKDEGIGIPPEDLDKIFERFYRADKARSRHQGGTGLGLSIAKLIVTAHSGTIYAESELNIGTTIVINLPLTEGEVI